MFHIKLPDKICIADSIVYLMFSNGVKTQSNGFKKVDYIAHKIRDLH